MNKSVPFLFGLLFLNCQKEKDRFLLNLKEAVNEKGGDCQHAKKMMKELKDVKSDKPEAF